VELTNVAGNAKPADLCISLTAAMATRIILEMVNCPLDVAGDTPAAYLAVASPTSNAALP